MKLTIQNLAAHAILDSRGWPTVEAVLTLSNGHHVIASVPAGASVGEHEVAELRDGQSRHYQGKGVEKAVALIMQQVAPQLVGKAPDVPVVDALLAGQPANVSLPVSIAVLRAQAHASGMPLYKLIVQLAGATPRMPRCMANILNGGAHATNGMACQELMVVPAHMDTFAQHVHTVATTYHALKQELKNVGLSADVGDEGGFAPRLPGTGFAQITAGLNLIELAATRAGIALGRDLFLAADVAASELYDRAKKAYNLGVFSRSQEWVSANQLTTQYAQLCNDYPLISIEDGLDQNDWRGWQQLTTALGKSTQLVGDDIFVTNQERLRCGIDEGIANSILVKPNQIGTVSATLATISVARRYGYSVVVSHRSGETNDPFIADLAVGVGAEFIKLGAPCRGERVAKYNRLVMLDSLLD